MSSTTFAFDPRGPGMSRDLDAKLESVFGAARWVHNRAMIAQWDSIRGKLPMPSLSELIEYAIDEPSKSPETAWLQKSPRAVLVDELKDLVLGTEDLADAQSWRDLPLKKKKEEQEIIFPLGSFTFMHSIASLGIILDEVGLLNAPMDLLTGRGGPYTDLKIERDSSMIYTATLFFEKE